MRKKTKI